MLHSGHHVLNSLVPLLFSTLTSDTLTPILSLFFPPFSVWILALGHLSALDCHESGGKGHLILGPYFLGGHYLPCHPSFFLWL